MYCINYNVIYNINTNVREIKNCACNTVSLLGIILLFPHISVLYTIRLADYGACVGMGLQGRAIQSSSSDQ